MALPRRACIVSSRVEHCQLRGLIRLGASFMQGPLTHAHRRPIENNAQTAPSRINSWHMPCCGGSLPRGAPILRRKFVTIGSMREELTPEEIIALRAKLEDDR